MASIPMTSSTAANAKSQFMRPLKLRIDENPTIVNRSPQVKMLKAPRSYFEGFLRLIPPKIITQNP